ncbi:Malic oxidoreductase protein [Raphanus sativus]|nr:Malic oxidoreductase protein [Raphanus sativus]
MDLLQSRNLGESTILNLIFFRAESSSSIRISYLTGTNQTSLRLELVPWDLDSLLTLEIHLQRQVADLPRGSTVSICRTRIRCIASLKSVPWFKDLVPRFYKQMPRLRIKVILITSLKCPMVQRAACPTVLCNKFSSGFQRSRQEFSFFSSISNHCRELVTKHTEDLGVQGIGIPIGKLDMYVAAAGINPLRVLPIMLDVDTNNQKLLQNPLYLLGLKQPRLEGDEYLEIIDEFMEAAFTRWPKAVVQFEDFQAKWAFETLERYRNKFCMFNDDVQGTAGVALAGLLGTVRAQGRPLSIKRLLWWELEVPVSV